MSWSRTSLRKSDRGPKIIRPIQPVCGVCGQNTDAGKILCQKCVIECQLIPLGSK